VADVRFQPGDPEGWRYQNFGGGFETFYQFTDPEGLFNSGRPYVGEVYYGGDRGTTGHYPDLGRRDVRDWWGRQYQHLFDLGLEMVWQDMTTPAIRETRGDMRGFPFRLFVTDDSMSSAAPQKTQAIRVWNLYSYNLHKATYHGLNHLNGRANTRNFLVGRGSFSGMHRFAALWPGDKALYNDKVEFLDDQFLVGNDLLVAPLLEPQSDTNAGGRRDIYLPAGSQWYCFMDNRLPLAAPVEGGTTIRGFDASLYLDNANAHIDFLLPTYVRAGAILPTLELEQFVGERHRNGQPNPITLNVYPGANGQYVMYLDDGVSRSSAPDRAEDEGG